MAKKKIYTCITLFGRCIKGIVQGAKRVMPARSFNGVVSFKNGYFADKCIQCRGILIARNINHSILFENAAELNF